jgi:hypothetical protein
MTATVSIQEGNGASVTWTTITSGRYCTTDSNAPGSNNPCVVPASGYNYSYWKHHVLAFTGTFTSISNIRWYTSGAIKTNWALGTSGTGGMLMVGVLDTPTNGNGCPYGSYDQADGTAGTTGYYMKDSSNGHTYYRGQSVGVYDADSYLSASPLTVDTNTYTTSSSPAISYAVVTQVKIASDATQGDKASETLTFRYDEI